MISDLGVILFFGTITFTLVMDGTGVINLRGRVFPRMSRGVAIVLGVFFFGLLFFWLIPYLIIAALDARKSAALSAGEHFENIAKLEGALGILPPAEGVCPNCHKPLQLGAEFCAYCGKPLTPRCASARSVTREPFPTLNGAPSAEPRYRRSGHRPPARLKAPRSGAVPPVRTAD